MRKNIAYEAQHAYYMRAALREAMQGGEAGEVPVGAVVVCRERIVGRGHNMTECLQDPTAHAEMLAITAACENLGSKSLEGCTLYVTLEPCPMCASALFQSRVSSLFYGATDPKRGFTQFQPNLLHPRTVVQSGLLADECALLLRTFFSLRR